MNVLGMLLLYGCALEPPRAPALTLTLTDKLMAYPVYGATADEVRDFIDSKAPVPSPERTGGLHFDAYTNWRILWSHTTQRSGSLCYAIPADVSLTVIEVVPEWTPPAGTPPDLVASWAAYDAAIRAHEGRHKAIAIEGGEAIIAALAALPGQPTCPLASAALDDAAQAVLAEYKRKQAAFDEETNHGANQGVVFP